MTNTTRLMGKPGWREQTKQPQPDPREQDQSPEDECKRGNGWRGLVGADRAEKSTGHSEEPRTGLMRLEGLATEEGPCHDRSSGDRTEECGATEAHRRELGGGHVHTNGLIPPYGLVRNGCIGLKARGNELHSGFLTRAAGDGGGAGQKSSSD
jgi:hypothetical protein